MAQLVAEPAIGDWDFSGRISVTISSADFIAIVEAACDWHDYFPDHSLPINRKSDAVNISLRTPKFVVPPAWATELRKMFDSFGELEFNSTKAPTLNRLAEIGSRFGMRRLEAQIPPELWNDLTPRAKMRLKRHLERKLAQVTKPCFALELSACRFAYEAICSQEKLPFSEKIVGKPRDRLFALFKKFPVLARLWSDLICQWCEQVAESLLRFRADRRALSRVFFNGQPIGNIIGLRTGLSDPHNRGRSVALLQFEAGSIIYKPRSGDGEWEWFKLLRWMNARSFRPQLKAARVLPRKQYCWMEQIAFASCKDRAAAKRFYQRLGGMIASAYLLKAVDCHRDNMIASGEDPVLVDAEALWHVSGEEIARTPLDALCDTGFLPRPDRLSRFQDWSSVLPSTTLGKHIPRIASKPLRATQYDSEIISGFRRAWHCILGTADRRAAFKRRLRHLQLLQRRWIYWSTKNYDLIGQAAIQPATLRSGVERELLIARLCDRRSVSSTVLRAEIDALKRFDIPYFSRKIKSPLLCEKQFAPAQVIEALRHTLKSGERF